MIRKIVITAATGFESKPSCRSLTYLVEILAEIAESHCRRELASFHRSRPPARAARLWRGLRHLAHRPRRLRRRRCTARGARRRAPARHRDARRAGATRGLHALALCQPHRTQGRPPGTRRARHLRQPQSPHRKGIAPPSIRGYVVESLMARGYDEPFTL